MAHIRHHQVAHPIAEERVVYSLPCSPSQSVHTKQEAFERGKRGETDQLYKAKAGSIEDACHCGRTFNKLRTKMRD